MSSTALFYLLDRARESSSWRGIVWLLTAFGVAVTPEQAAAIMAAGAALAGLIAVFTKDQPPTTASTAPLA